MADILENLLVIVAVFATVTACVALFGICVWMVKEMLR